MDNAWVLILAAGASSRFDGIKALAPWQGGTLLSQALKTARTVCADRVMVVTGAHHAALLPQLTSCNTVLNAEWECGMGSSIACGVAAIEDADPTAEIILILPVDQPFVTAAHLQNLFDASQNGGKAVFTQQSQVVGPPAALPRILFSKANQLDGETGLKNALDPAKWMTIESSDALIDIDTAAEWQRASLIRDWLRE